MCGSIGQQVVSEEGSNSESRTRNPQLGAVVVALDGAVAPQWRSLGWLTLFVNLQTRRKESNYLIP